MLPPWYARAKKEVGISEVAGPGNNPRIVLFHSFTTLRSNEDATPWCSSFVCAMFELEGIPSTKSAAAKSWLKWGLKCDKPFVGCVTVLQGPKGFHVGFYAGEKPGRVILLGGNQRDSVCELSFPAASVVGYRRPEEKYWSPDATNSDDSSLG